MNHHIIAVLAAALIALGTAAQGKLDGKLRHLLHTAEAAPGSRSAFCSDTVTVLVSTVPGMASMLEHPGLSLVPLSSGVVSATGSLSDIVGLSASPDVRFISSTPMPHLLLDKARQASDVDLVHSGEATDQPYDGSGVVVGIMDVGVDPNHRTFYTPDSVHRITNLWNFSRPNGTFTHYEGTEVATYSTDNPTETHGTHVLGILAGGYNGMGEYASSRISLIGNDNIEQGPIPYYGIATGAEIVVSCGTPYTINMLEGARQCADYARSVGKPAVINISLGINTGPHDNSDPFNEAISEIGRDAIICIAAGNEGADDIALVKTLSESDTTASTIIKCSGASRYSAMDGELDIWLSDSCSVTTSLVIYDAGTDSVTRRFECPPYGSIQTIGSALNATRDSLFEANFSGSVTMSQQVNPLNNRVNIVMDITSVGITQSNYPQRLYLGVEINGKPGQRADIYTETTSRIILTDLNNDRFDAPTGEMSINSMACAENVIAVGAYTTKNVWGRLNGNAYSINSTKGEICRFSSWGFMPDGTRLPHVCAPGEMVASAVSGYYTRSYGQPSQCVARTGSITGGTDYYNVYQGTSMACPVVAGTIALWLQAHPDLTVDDVLEVIRNSSTVDQSALDDPYRWGAGKINALEGLRYLGNGTSLIQPGTDPSASLAVHRTHGALTATLPGAAGMLARLHNTAGQLMAEERSSSDQVTLQLGDMAPGVYILTVDTPSGRATRRLVLTR